MKKFKYLFVIALACLFILPLAVFAEGEEETTAADSKEVTVYFFRGEGCSHCAEFESWLQEIEPEYGELFNVVDYETWYNTDNADLMQKVAASREEEANGVPYIIIGNKSWNGFADEYKSEILDEIKELYNKDPSERFDVMKNLDTKKADDNSTTKDIISLIVILAIAGLIVFGVVKTRKSSK